MINAFDVYCRMEHLTPAEAIRQLAQGRGRGRSSYPRAGAHAPVLDLAPDAEEGGAR